MIEDTPVIRVAIPAPLSRCFDYLMPVEPGEFPSVGVRVEVPFGRGTRVGVVLGHATNSAVVKDKLKPVKRVLDRESVVPADILNLIEWASNYYHHPIGEVAATALPTALRKANEDIRTEPVRVCWRLSAAGTEIDPDTLRRSPLQRKLIEHLNQHESADREALSVLGSSWRQSLSRLAGSGLVESFELDDAEVVHDFAQQQTGQVPPLNSEQQVALDAIKADNAGFHTYLVEGVTGSGKTELYLRYAAQIIDRQQQVLVIVPEIGLTPQLIERFTTRFGSSVIALHSSLTDLERLRNWRLAAQGRARIVIGTRSSVFVPFQALGLIVIDEEHDGSLKQQDGFRYHARDLALVRARNAGIPILLGSATPSLETLHNARSGKYQHLRLTRRAGDAAPPTIHLLDLRRHPPTEGLSLPLVDKMKQHIEQGNQVMLFLNRRGFAPAMLCDNCGEIADCRRCDAHMTVHASSRRLRCHHCGSERPVPVVCESCGGRELAMAGQGTERIDYALRALFPEQTVVRIDRDTTRRKGALQAQLELARSGAANILVGTQMLAKGHHFPKVTLVAMLDVDRGLFGVDFRAAEQMAQTIIQVAGRAGREVNAGEVIIQTRNPDSDLFQTLIHKGYASFAADLLTERKTLSLPPFSSLALLRAEASSDSAAKAFLQHVRDRVLNSESTDIAILGPASAPVERVAGRYRAQLLLRSGQRRPLHQVLDKLRPTLESMPESRKVRWSLDVDPIDLM